MRVAEYFAGIGLARIGLEAAGFKVAWANDMSPRKQAMYAQRFGDSGHYHLGDVVGLTAATDPESIQVAWASFPCTDLSLAGGRGGLNSGASSAFWGFVSSIRRMGASSPKVIALENVMGLATSHGGADIIEAVKALNDLGYSVDILRIDAKQFVPQSRVRLFLIGDRRPPVSSTESHDFRPPSLDWLFDQPTLRTHRYPLPPAPTIAHGGLDALVRSQKPAEYSWWEPVRVEAFLSSLTAAQQSRVGALRALAQPTHRTAYRRMRDGVPRWEIRPDEIAGCLRTARGGSSRQAIVRAGRKALDVRWMTPAEYAALMGATGFATDLMSSSDAQWGFGDAVCVPVVEWIANHAILPRVQRPTSA